MGNNKQPSLKKGIIYLIIVVIIIAIGFSLVGQNNTSKTDKTSKDNNVKTTKIQKKSKTTTKKETAKDVNKRTPAEEERFVDGVGQAFGQKDSQTIQKYDGSIYQSAFVDGLGMTYTWKTSDATYIRVDNTDNGITTVYLYDETANNHLGRQLYQGETIKQMAPRDNYNQ